jgi:hypothetical protein
MRNSGAVLLGKNGHLVKNYKSTREKLIHGFTWRTSLLFGVARLSINRKLNGESGSQAGLTLKG